MTTPTMTGLNAISSHYEGQDLVTLIFPCPDFFNQEQYNVDKPEELLNEFTYVRPGGGYQIDATQIFQKISVNGENEAPFYTFFKNSCPNTWENLFPKAELNYSPERAKDVYWNYEKFLIARNGSVYARYSSTVYTLIQLRGDINTLLAESA